MADNFVNLAIKAYKNHLFLFYIDIIHLSNKLANEYEYVKGIGVLTRDKKTEGHK